MDNFDIFISNKIYPDATDIFSTRVQSVESLKKDCLFVLDTNALLVPYTTSSKSIDEVKKVYLRLIKEKRLFIPGQVAREFAKNRPEKIKELFQQLNRKREKLQKLYTGQYPLLTSIKEYNEAVEQEQKIDETIKEYSKKLSKVIEQIKSWTWNDPVSEVYNSFFDKSVIIDLEINEQEIQSELKKRYLHKIPPGFKDESKPDDGVGDLLIWLTMLSLGEKTKKDIIFVSGEEKTDWFYKSEGQTLYPRFELISEFRRRTEKKSFQIIKLYELLEIFGADERVVKEIEIEEKNTRLHSIEVIQRRRAFMSIVTNWIIDSYGRNNDFKIQEIGFPDILLVETDTKKKIGFEIVQFSRPESFLFRFNDLFNRAFYEATTQKLDKMIFVVVLPETTTLRTILERVERIKERKVSNFDFEIIIGFINPQNQFQMI